MRNLTIPFLVLALSLLIGCIGDDIIDDTVAARINFTNPLDSIAVGDTFQFQATFLNQVGLPEDVPVSWSARPASLLQILSNGLAIGLMEGEAWVIATADASGGAVRDSFLITVGASTSEPVAMAREGTIRTTSSYLLEGTFTASLNEEGEVVIDIEDDYRASDRLPGLYVYLTNNPTTTNGAYEIGEVTIFEGAHSYTLPSDIGLNEYNYLLYFCKPFNVKVGDGEME